MKYDRDVVASEIVLAADTNFFFVLCLNDTQFVAATATELRWNCPRAAKTSNGRCADERYSFRFHLSSQRMNEKSRLQKLNVKDDGIKFTSKQTKFNTHARFFSFPLNVINIFIC